MCFNFFVSLNFIFFCFGYGGVWKKFKPRRKFEPQNIYTLQKTFARILKLFPAKDCYDRIIEDACFFFYIVTYFLREVDHELLKQSQTLALWKKIYTNAYWLNCVTCWYRKEAVHRKNKFLSVHLRLRSFKLSLMADGIHCVS